jgi:FKBP-type peptidyl-prolyl cis-trans isomerase FkpA
MRTLALMIAFICNTNCFSQPNEQYSFIPDSVKAAAVLKHFSIKAIHPRKENKIGIKADEVYLYIEAEKKEREISMEFPENFSVVAKGTDVEADKDELEWQYNWKLNETYGLYIATATDSASNFILYSGYIYFPNENKWKLIGTVKQTGRWGTIKTAATFRTFTRKQGLIHEQTEDWLQRSNGSWKNMLNTASAAPMLSPMSNKDSSARATADDAIIQQHIKEKKTDAVTKHEDVYYTIMKEGTGKQVKVTDTVTVFYKGYLLSDGSVFDQTKEKPVTFPLNRLIKGWQIGVPLLKTGGKIKIIIPSGLAYSIRTRSPKIPPNSILVFEIEVVDVK